MSFWMNDRVDRKLLSIAVKTAEKCDLVYGDLIDDYREIDGFERAVSHESLCYANEYKCVNDALNAALWTIREWNETNDVWGEDDTWSPELAKELGKVRAAINFIKMIQEDEKTEI